MDKNFTIVVKFNFGKKNGHFLFSFGVKEIILLYSLTQQDNPLAWLEIIVNYL